MSDLVEKDQTPGTDGKETGNEDGKTTEGEETNPEDQQTEKDSGTTTDTDPAPEEDD